ncbi:EAL domain-containing response regulator [Pseudoalteromonas aurantia]|uniref:Response regulator n=1 Tax=Pseudoalteromonas aurantia TaxID=43654 RepID=A0A5S3V710_9GAMM|nr:EAL domain-containing protein [Pseudoalteromonas aurantia]TMO67496.1 response regulator [Pseudoalteromonas aurantia]
MEKPRVLVVDDSEVQRAHVIGLCEVQGIYDFDIAENGLVALEKLTLAKYDLAFIDLEMPVMDGVELVRRIAEKKLVKSVIILSSKDPSLILSIGTMAENDGLSVVGSFQKPLKGEELVTSLKRFERGLAQVKTEQAKIDLTEQDILQGILKKEIILHYQPKLTVKGLLFKGVEALSRWHHPKRGDISPVEFIAAAERYGIISKLTIYLFEQALKQKADWFSHGLNFHLSFNLSPLSLSEYSLADDITAQVENYHVSPKDIVFEITENALCGEVSKAIETLAKLRLKGFKIAIDDYGTGFANAQQLSRVPATELKLDRILVDNVATNPQQQAILKSTVGLSKDLQLETVAEGIEHLEDFKFIHQLNVDLVQGYYFAKPMAADLLIDWLSHDLTGIRNQLTKDLTAE